MSVSTTRNLMMILAAAMTLWGCKRPPTPVANDIPKLEFEKYTLPNGLTVILSEDHRLPLVAVNLWYHVGPANERAGRTGFAHLFEHMMFQGSKNIGNDMHFKLLEAAGASSINGTTGFDRTNYFETLPSNELELALWIESDRMGFLLDTLDQQKLTGQIDVVRNERRQSRENAPYGLVEEELYHQLFPAGHPYYASIIGSHADLEAVRLDDVRQFFREYYAPNNASLAIVGDIDRTRVKALVEKYFGPIPMGTAIDRSKVATPPITAERRAIVTDKVELARVYMGWLTAPFYQPGDADADLLGQVLGGGKSSRLYKKLVYEKQLAQDVSAYQQSMALQSVFTIEATARPGVKVDELETAIEEELAALRNDGPTEVELERARNGIETDIVRGLQTLGGFGGIADRLNQYNHYLGNPDYLAADIGRYRAATVGSVRTLAQQLTPTSRVVVYGMPGSKVLKDIPRTPPPAVTATAAAEPVKDWRATQPAAAAASTLTLPVPEQFRLDNGLTVLLLPQHKLPMVSAALVTLRGSESNAPSLPGLASFTADMLDEGTASRSTLQLADDVAQLGATLTTGAGSDNSNIGISVLRKNVDAAFTLLADVALRPAFDPAEIERVRKRRQTSLLQQNDNPVAISVRVFNRAVYGDSNPYGFIELGTTDSLQKITRDDLQGFWQGYVPENTALIVAGDLSSEELKQLATEKFGMWQGSVPAVTPSPIPPPTRRVVMVDVAGAPQTALRIGAPGVARSNPDYVPLEVMNTVLGGQFSSRINMNLREEHGYTYGARSGFEYRRGPGPFTVRSSVRTDATAPAVREVFKELERIRAAPVAADELKASKDAFSRSLPGDFESGSQTVAALAQLYVYGLPLDYYRTLPASIDRVTATDVQHAATQYLQPGKMTVVAVGDRRSIAAPLAALKLGPVEVRDLEGNPPGAARR